MSLGQAQSRAIVSGPGMRAAVGATLQDRRQLDGGSVPDGHCAHTIREPANQLKNILCAVL